MSKATHLLVVLLCLFLSVPFLTKAQSSGSTIVYNYNLSSASRTSAGVYKLDGADTILIRTLWSGELKVAGLHSGYWDGKNDEGALVPNGSYFIKILNSNVQYQWQGVVGNTSENFSGTTVHHSAQIITAMVPVGTAMYTGVGYNEAQDVHSKFQLSQPNVVTTTLKKEGQVIRYLATDGNKVYSAGQGPGNFFITALNANPTGQDVLSTFSGGTTVGIKSHSYSAFGIANNSDFPNTPGIFGLAVQTSGNFIFGAYTSQNFVKTFNKSTGAFVNNNSFTAPREIVIQGENILWIITGTNSIAKYPINSNGTIGSSTLTLSGLTDPLALAVSPDGTRIAVADRGTVAHQVKIYNTTSGTLVSTIGRSENYSNPTVYDDKFYFSNTRIFSDADYGAAHCFLQFQPDGSLWVGDYGNMRCQHFSNNGTYINNIQHMGYSYSSQTDLNNPGRVFSDFLEFKVDYSKTLTPNNGSWKFVRNWSKNFNNAIGFDIDRMRSVVTLSNGRTYALYNTGGNRKVIELDTITGVRHTGINLDNNNCDINSDGSQWQIGSNHIGQPTFWKRKLITAFDGSNNPVWGSYNTLETTPNVTVADPLTLDGYLKRNQVTATGIVAAFNADNPPTNNGIGSGYHLGGFKNGKWLFKTSPSTHKNYKGLYPVDGTYDIGNGVNNPGSFMQVVENNIFWGYVGEFWKNTQVNKYNHYNENGLFVGQFGVTGDDGRRPDVEAYPGMAGNALSGTYVKVGNDIYLYHCDEGQHAGIHRWKISNLNTIQVQTVTVNKNGTPPPQVYDYTDLMAGLPFDDTLTNSTAGWTRFAPESNRFSVKSSFGTYKKTENDLRIFSLGQNVDCWVRRELGVNNGLVNWKIVGELAYPEAIEYGDNFIDIIDANGKVIVRLSRPDSYPNLEVKANGSRIAYGSEVYTTVGRLLPLSIVASGGNITVNFGDYAPVTVSPLDPQANIGSPTTMQLYTVSNPSGHQVNIARLKFYKNFGLAPGHFRSKTSGLWKNTGSWESSADSSNWNDATAVPDFNTTSIVIRNNHTITLSDTVAVDQLIVQNNGTFKIAPTALLTIKDGTGDDIKMEGAGVMLIQSDATGTGRIGNSTGTVNGNVTVERFLTSVGNKAYRLLAPTTNTANGPKPYIRNNWQEGQNNMSIMSNSNSTPNYGIHITGSMMGTNGFDATLTGITSLMYFNQTAANPAWMAAPNTNATNFDVKKGYLVYIRGDRSTDLHGNTTSSNTTLRTTGTIATGTQNFTAQEGSGRNSLVTNPYPCPVDWAAIYNDPTTGNSDKFESYYTYWDPNVGLSGGYVTVYTDGTKSAATNATTEIQSGQAFFIKAKAGAASSTFVVKESHKSGSGNSDIFRTGSREQFRTSLYFYDADGNRKMADGVTAVFDTAFSMGADGNDAEEMANWDENVAIKRWDKMISIEGRPLIDMRDTLQLSIQRLRMQSYEWQFDPTGFSHPGLWAYLDDKYTNVRTQISLTSPSIVTFSANMVPGSTASDRFRIVFTTNNSLPVTLLSLKAFQKGTGNQVEWKTGSELNIVRYEVEKSIDGRNFSKAGTVQSITGSLNNAYTWFDGQPIQGNNYYRLKMVDKNGQVTYSAIVNVKIGGKAEGFDVYPNPIKGNLIVVRFANIKRGSYTVNLINAMGQKVVTKTMEHGGGSGSQSLLIDNSLPSGTYNLQVTGNGISFNRKIMK